MATASQTPGSSPSAGPVPPLRNGDRLSAEEFLRRYDAMPDLKKAELIDGQVYIDSPAYHPTDRGVVMASPVFFHEHAAPHFDLIAWLGFYRSATPGVVGGDNGTVHLDGANLPQPDAMLLILPSQGGQARFGDNKIIHGAPELVAEVAYSSVRYDLHAKFEAYQRNGVREYVAWRIEAGEIDWFASRGGKFERLAPAEGGILKSEAFPGLWLDPAALIRGDLAAVIGTLQLGLATPEHLRFVEDLRRRGGGGL